MNHPIRINRNVERSICVIFFPPGTSDLNKDDGNVDDVDDDDVMITTSVVKMVR